MGDYAHCRSDYWLLILIESNDTEWRIQLHADCAWIEYMNFNKGIAPERMFDVKNDDRPVYILYNVFARP